MNIGILGTGIIASALVRGFCTAGTSHHFFLSPRNAEKAAGLSAAFPENVTVCEDNQQVVDNSQLVWLCLIPRMAEEILAPLKFRPEQDVLSIMSDHTIEHVRTMVGEVGRVWRMVPLPFAAMHIGPIAYFPKDEDIDSVFQPLGKVISMEKEGELSVISGLTGIMSAYYMLIHETVQFGVSQGLPQTAALEYMTSFYEALDIKARSHEGGDIYGLAYEMTPGGLNEMALKHILSEDGYKPWTDALQKVMDRLNK